jgi:Ca-activated chloride channel homolog
MRWLHVLTLGSTLAVMAAPVTAEANWWTNLWKREVPANQQGRDAYDRGEFEKSVEHFDGVTRRTKGENSRRAAFNRGNALAKAGRDAEALRAFSEAAESGDAKLRSDALHNRGWMREKKKDTQGAIDDYRQALVADSANERARHNLERLLQYVPPPPQEQPEQSEDSESDESAAADAENPQRGEQSPDEEDADERNEQAQGDESDPQDEESAADQGSAEPDEQPADGQEELAGDGQLTEKEADAMLDAIERESRHSPLGPTEKPPRDYDPQRNW